MISNTPPPSRPPPPPPPGGGIPKEPADSSSPKVPTRKGTGLTDTDWARSESPARSGSPSGRVSAGGRTYAIGEGRSSSRGELASSKMPGEKVLPIISREESKRPASSPPRTHTLLVRQDTTFQKMDGTVLDRPANPQHRSLLQRSDSTYEIMKSTFKEMKPEESLPSHFQRIPPLPSKAKVEPETLPTEDAAEKPEKKPNT